MKKKIQRIAVLFLIPFFFYMGTKIYLDKFWSRKSKTLPYEQVQIFLKKGSSLSSFAQDLEDKGLISSSNLFYFWLRLHKNTYEHFIAGNYRFVSKVNPQEIVSTITQGKTYNPIVLEFTIPEGASFHQIITSLIQMEAGTEEEFLTQAQDEDWLEMLKIKGVEGFLYPAKYLFYLNKPSARDILEKPIHEFFNRIPSNYKKLLEDASLTLEDWVNFASLIEKETAIDEERTLVSEVIWRRLRMGMPLGIDAALIYGIKDYDGNIRTHHLKDKKNLYNTRLHRGLPPTPIGSPSLKSLLAVFHPTNLGYLYYVRIPGPEKKHHFSKNIREHNLYVRKLVKAR